MGVKLLTEHHLQFLSFKGGCTGSSESTLGNCHIVGSHMSLLIYKLHNMELAHVFLNFSLLHHNEKLANNLFNVIIEIQKSTGSDLYLYSKTCVNGHSQKDQKWVSRLIIA